MEKIIAALENCQALFLDTAPIIYYVEDNPRYFSIVEPLFEKIDDGSLNIVTSPITLAECLIFPYRIQSEILKKAFYDLITQGKNTRFVLTNDIIAQQAAKLRSQYNLSLADALQISTAIVSKCDSFLTNDIDLKRVQEIKIIVIDDWL